MLQKAERKAEELLSDYEKKCKDIEVVKYSQLSLNGRLSKTDTSLRRTPCVGLCRFSVILL